MINQGHGAPNKDSQGNAQGETRPSTPLDRSDVRVKHSASLGDSISAFFDRIKSGDLGSLPVIAGLVIIGVGIVCSRYLRRRAVSGRGR